MPRVLILVPAAVLALHALGAAADWLYAGGERAPYLLLAGALSAGLLGAIAAWWALAGRGKRED